MQKRTPIIIGVLVAVAASMSFSFFLGCDAGMPSVSSLSPPTWIHGTWERRVLDVAVREYVFDSGSMKIVVRSGNTVTTTDIAKLASASSARLTEQASNAQYVVTLTIGHVSDTYTFEPINANRLKLTLESNLDIGSGGYQHQTKGTVTLYRR